MLPVCCRIAHTSRLRITLRQKCWPGLGGKNWKRAPWEMRWNDLHTVPCQPCTLTKCLPLHVSNERPRRGPQQAKYFHCGSCEAPHTAQYCTVLSPCWSWSNTSDAAGCPVVSCRGESSLLPGQACEQNRNNGPTSGLSTPFVKRCKDLPS
ncbi:hypothetical protein B0O99DRAFT_257261 [Bisporella sp. PMI_857]|nr:hypothetical protein B0O99DRAFT_257261 [Bisporella sp. PMI_857]